MTVGKIAAIVVIYLGISAAWMLLGASVHLRTEDRHASGGEAVEALWGSEHLQTPPRAFCVWKERVAVPGGKGKPAYREVEHRVPLGLAGSDVDVDLDWEPRRKGLLWHRTYRVGFDSRYTFQHAHGEPHSVEVEFAFPTARAIYDDFRFRVDGRESDQAISINEGIREHSNAGPGKPVQVHVAYRSQGIDRWGYHFGDSVTRVKEFRLGMTTDFTEIDFPEQTLSPTSKERTARGWKLGWDYKSLISGFQIGMEMPARLNPGPLAARMSFFAPVSLLFFFFMLFVITVVRDLKLHPMHYLFLGAAFFSFHLLFSYLADHLLPLPAFLICSTVSVGLVVSYLRLVTGTRFALVEAGTAQLVYLVLFSYAFFFEGFTGLAITLLSILSLFVVMQVTGKVNWEKKFKTPQRRTVPRRPAEGIGGRA